MTTPRVLVSGCARSGTGYLSALLTRLGLRCGHELVFNPYRTRAASKGRLDVAPPWPVGARAESSWLAAPFLESLPDGTLVLHQVRHPLRVVRSNLRIRFFETPTPYLDFALRHLPALASGTNLERGARYWVGWNGLVERAAAMPRLRYRRYRLEDVGEPLVRELLAEIGLDLPASEVSAALADVPRDTNTRGCRLEDAVVRLEDLPAGPLAAELDALARRYGYPDALGTPPRSLVPDSLQLF